MPIHELTRTEYRAARKHDNAGPATHLRDSTINAWRQSCPAWKGKHWALIEGTALVPANVVADPPTESPETAAERGDLPQAPEHIDQSAGTDAVAEDKPFRIEIRTDFYGTEAQAWIHAQQLANQCFGEITAMFDVENDFEELPYDDEHV
ncbi:hypothetical protein [Nocardia sp. NPDC003963]